MTAGASDPIRESRVHAAPAHQDRAYEYVRCPVTGAAAKNADDLDPSNLVIGTRVFPRRLTYAGVFSTAVNGVASHGEIQ